LNLVQSHTLGNLIRPRLVPQDPIILHLLTRHLDFLQAQCRRTSFQKVSQSGERCQIFLGPVVGCLISNNWWDGFMVYSF
jgi:hypothetical protein